MTQNEMTIRPKFHRGENVYYEDRNGRMQSGRILSIELHWPAWQKYGLAPYMLYEIEHPTYRNKHITLNANDLEKYNSINSEE